MRESLCSSQALFKRLFVKNVKMYTYSAFLTMVPGVDFKVNAQEEQCGNLAVVVTLDDQTFFYRELRLSLAH